MGKYHEFIAAYMYCICSKQQTRCFLGIRIKHCAAIVSVQLVLIVHAICSIYQVLILTFNTADVV